MSLKKYVLEDLKKGDHVALSYGQNQQAVGIVLDLNEDLIQIQTQKGKSRILLDSIISYETIEIEEPAPAPAAKAQEQAAPARPAPAREPTAEERIITEMEGSRVPPLEEVADLKGIRAAAKAMEDRDVLRMVGSILDAASSAEKQQGSGREDKLRDTMARARSAIRDYPQGSPIFQRVLGALYLMQSEFGRAEEAFRAAGWYKGAAYAAQWGSHPKELRSYLERYLRSEEVWERDLVRQYVDQAVSSRDVSALCDCLRRDAAPEEERLRSLIDCAVYLAHKGGFSIRWTDPADLYSVDNLRAVLASLPSDWNTGGGEPESAPPQTAESAPEQEAVWQTGAIKNYYGSCFGFIREKDTDCYFYIRQVKDEDIDLRQALYCGEWKNLEVRYQNGVGLKGRSASAIELTERGRAEARKRLARYRAGMTAPQELCRGRIERYSQENDWGAIWYDGASYGFYRSAVADPFLRAYLDNLFDFGAENELEVTFVTDVAKNGKTVAKQVAAAQPFPEAERQEWLRRRDVTAEEAQRWQARLEKGQEEPEGPEPLAPDEDPYPHLNYEALEPWREQEVKPKAAAPAVPVPASEPAPVPVQPGENGEECYRRAYQAAAGGELKKAEQLFLQALAKGGRAENCVAELVTLYLRQEDRVKDAFAVLDQYGGCLPEEKRMNLELQVCQKGKDRETRERLVRVLGDAIEMTPKISARFHYMMLRGNALRQLGEYDMALRVYQQWRDLYNSELQAMGGRAVTQYSGRLNAIKRGEACCYYFLGDMEKAQSLARELRRVNADDEAAQAILNGTLAENMMALELDSGSGDEESALPPEEDEMADRSLSEYVKDRIRELDMGSLIKNRYSRNIEDGTFTGTPEEAVKVIEVILSEQGSSFESKSKHLLCAAKILSQVWEGHGDKWASLNRQDLLRRRNIRINAGRSMAAYGNYLMSTPATVVTAANSAQADSARFLYLESLRLLNNREEQNYVNSFTHYITSYFCGQEEMQKRVRESGRLSSCSIQQGLSMLKGSQGAPLSEEELAYGMLQLLAVLRSSDQGRSPARNRDSMNRLIRELEEALYQSPYQKAIRAQFRRMGIGDEGPTIMGFKTELRAANAEAKVRETTLKAALSAAADQPLGGLAQSEKIAALRDESWALWMSCTDWERLKKSVQLMTRLSQAGDAADFEQREDILSTVIGQIVQLCTEISQWPTRISYLLLRPELLRIRETLAMERGKLYRLSPHITLEQSSEIAPYIDRERSDVVCVHLMLSNGPGLQMADNIQLHVSCPEGVSLLGGEEARLRGIRGGGSEEIILRFLVDSATWEQGSFAISVEGEYSYKRDAQNIEQGRTEPTEFAVVLRKSGEPISNVFRGLDRSEMTEDSMFFGRDEIINSMVDMMRLPTGRFNYGHGLVLYGQTRAGKSSILFHLKKRVRRTYGDRVLLVDLGNIHEVANTGNLFINLLYRIVGELEEIPSAIRRTLEERMGCTLADYRERFLAEPQYAEVLFSGLMRKLDNLLEEPEQGEPMMILLMMDEFSCIHEEIRKGSLPQRFMYFWKALLENHAIFTVVAGQDDMPQFIQENQNAFMAMQLMKVTYLEEQAAKRLISEPILLPDGGSRYIDSALDEMYRLTAGSAFLILLLSAALVDYLNKRGADRVTKAIIDGFLRERVFCGNSCLTSATFEAQLQDRSDGTLEGENTEVLTAVARASRRGGRAEYADIRKLCPQIGGERLDWLLDRLAERDVLVCEMGQDTRYYRIEVELLARWLLYLNGAGD